MTRGNQGQPCSGLAPSARNYEIRGKGLRVVLGASVACTEQLCRVRVLLGGSCAEPAGRNDVAPVLPRDSRRRRWPWTSLPCPTFPRARSTPGRMPGLSHRCREGGREGRRKGNKLGAPLASGTLFSFLGQRRDRARPCVPQIDEDRVTCIDAAAWGSAPAGTGAAFSSRRGSSIKASLSVAKDRYGFPIGSHQTFLTTKLAGASGLETRHPKSC